MKVLLVDDDPDILGGLQLILERRFGPRVQVATSPSGDGARARIEAGEAFDLVITDERMPGLQGLQLLAWLRTARPRTRRALMSAYVEPIPADAQAAAAEAVLRKPQDILNIGEPESPLAPLFRRRPQS